VIPVDELVNLVTQKAGISQDQAQKAVTTVVGFLKQKLPAPLAGELDKFMGGGAASGSAGMGGMAKEAENILGQFAKR
jgi:hypothetical protein